MRTLALITLTAAALGLGASGASAAQRLDVRGTVKMLPGGTLKQRGSFTGTPLGSGTLEVTTTLGRGRGALVSFRMYNRRGQVWGSGDAKVTFKGSTVVYSGSAKITGGSGAFSRIRGSNLTVGGSGALSNGFAVHIAGPISS